MTISVAAYGREIVFNVVTRNAKIPVNGTLTVSQVGEPSVRQEFALQSGTAIAELPPEPEWTLRLDADGWWAAPQIITAGAASPIIVPAWRTGVVRGRFVAARASPMPKAARLVIESPPDLRAPPEIARHTTFDCPVENFGAWSCRIPATTLDVAVVVGGFIPVYRWDVKVDQAHDTILGDIPLRRGASFVAWLDGESVRSLEGPAKARLLRGVGNDPSITTARLAAPVAEATFGRRGGVQLADIPPGVYVLEVTAQGFAPSRIHPIEIREQREAVLRWPILLERPLTLRLVIDPPADPNGAPWNVDLRRDGDFGERSDPTPINVRRLTESPGIFEVPDQSPGRFSLQVSDARRELRVRRRLDIGSAADIQQTISIPLVRVRGAVTFGGAPVAARLFFGRRDGADRVTLDANAGGVFEGWLSRAGSWPVDIDVASEDASSSINVVVPESEQEIAIHIPDTIVTGTVTDAGGERARQASVTLSAEPMSVIETSTRPDGTFRIRGARTGPAILHARDRRTGEESQAVSILIAERGSNEVELRIESGRPLNGIVTSGGVPVPGAAVSAYPILHSSSSQVRGVTDLAGRFELQVPISTRRALVAVRAAGRVLQSFEVVVGDEPAALDLATVGGTVRLLLPPAASPFVLRRNGVIIPSLDLFEWSGEQIRRGNGGRSLTLRNLAPGMYEACIPASARCAQRALTPNSIVDLDVQ